MSGCFRLTPSRLSGSGTEEGSFTLPAINEDSKLCARERDLHKQVALEVSPTLAARDALTINLTCVDEFKGLAQGAANSAGTSGPPVEVAQRYSVVGAESARASNGGLSGRPMTPPSLLTAASMRMSINGSSRGFVRVQSLQVDQGFLDGAASSALPPAPPPDLQSIGWTPSRRILESLIQRETTTLGQQGSGNLGAGVGQQEKRLNERLERLSLDMVIMAGDGNCQFRALANELFGSQEHHRAVRRQVLQHITDKQDEFAPFLGEDFDTYVKAMSCNGTWGDELTLRAACDSFGAIVRCITSEEANWYITYEPHQQQSNRELFLAYISPIHYNALRRRSSLRRLTTSMSAKLRGSMGRSRNGSSASLVLANPEDITPSLALSPKPSPAAAGGAPVLGDVMASPVPAAAATSVGKGQQQRESDGGARTAEAEEVTQILRMASPHPSPSPSPFSAPEQQQQQGRQQQQGQGQQGQGQQQGEGQRAQGQPGYGQQLGYGQQGQGFIRVASLFPLPAASPSHGPSRVGSPTPFASVSNPLPGPPSHPCAAVPSPSPSPFASACAPAPPTSSCSASGLPRTSPAALHTMMMDEGEQPGSPRGSRGYSSLSPVHPRPSPRPRSHANAQAALVTTAPVSGGDLSMDPGDLPSSPRLGSLRNDSMSSQRFRPSSNGHGSSLAAVQ